MAYNFSYTAQVIQPEGKIVYEYNPLYNYRKDDSGELSDLVTSSEDENNPQLNFDLNHPVEIECQKSYDGSVNLILNDNKNQPRLINTRFTPRENNTYKREDRLGNTDTNLYDRSEFEIDTSLVKKYINIPKVRFSGVYYGGNLPVGNYTFYFKLADADGNETDIVAESGLVTIHMGSINVPNSIRGGEQDENSGKLVQFKLSNIDSGYDYVTVYYTRTTSVDNRPRTTTATQIINKFRVRQNICSIHITGNEESQQIPVANLNQDFFLASSAKTQAVCQNMLFLGNVKKFTPEYSIFSKLSLGFVPYYESENEKSALGSELEYTYSSGGYYNVQNIYNKVGYWNEELYRFGVVYILENGALTPVYSIRGRNNVPKYSSIQDADYTKYKDVVIDYDTQIINEATIENSAGVCRIVDTDISDSYFKVRNFRFVPQDGLLEDLVKNGVKGYFFVRQKRIPTILCQAFMIGRDTFSGIPAWKIEDSRSNKDVWLTESFLDSQGYITHDYASRLVTLDENKAQASVGLCPEYEMNQAYYNTIFTGSKMAIKQDTTASTLYADDNHMYTKSYEKSGNSLSSAKVITVPDSGIVRDGNTVFKNIAGTPEELRFEYISNKTNVPIKKNFAHLKLSVLIKGGKFFGFKTEDVTNKVKIVRGLYGPYVGIYGNNSIAANSLVNIYIPGYDVSQMLEYFKIRINCEDGFYPVSDRKSIDELSTNGEKIYRGDCFISQFTHRLNRNFQDPSAPTNDTIIEDDSWRENYDEDETLGSEVNRGDINAVRIGTYFTFKCYSTYNLAMRDWDASFPAEEALMGGKRTFYPLSPIRVDGHSKIPEAAVFNQGFSATTGERVNILQPAVPYLKNTYQTRVVYSDIAQTDAFKNGFRVFKSISFVDYSNQYGGITKILEWSGNLIIVFEHAIGLAAVNQNALIPTDDGTQIAVGAVKPLASTLVMISTDFGTQWPESVCCSQKYIYGVDTVGKKIWRTDGRSFGIISDFKVQKFLNDNITLGERELTPIIGVRNVKTHYNAYKNDIMFTYYDNTYGFEEKVWNLCYNESQDAFPTFYSWVPSHSANIDNIFFTYDRNSAKWISKLGMSTKDSGNENGIYMEEPLIKENMNQKLFLSANIPTPKEAVLEFSIERDNFGYCNYFGIDPESKRNLIVKDYTGLLKHWLTINGKQKEPIIPCVQLNIRCTVITEGDTWSRYKYVNSAYYESQVFLTLPEIRDTQSKVTVNTNGTISVEGATITVNGITVNLPTLETDFWKHGFAGLIDVQEKIRPCFWYHKQHPFEFEYITGNDNPAYKQFDNLLISSNNVAPESIHYSIIGDSYDFSDQKQGMYFRQEATKAFYQYNGADIIFDHDVFDKTKGYLPDMVTTASYIERDEAGNPLRHTSAVSSTYRDTMFPLIYTKQDTFNEVEDFYKKISAHVAYADYPNITGGEIQWDASLNQFSICNHVKARDIREVGRTRGNIQYVNDKWWVQITPLNVLNRNATWVNTGKQDSLGNNIWLPKLVVNNVPKEVIDFTGGEITTNNFPKELGYNDSDKEYILGKYGVSYDPTYLDGTDWATIANSRKEVKLMDKYLKTRIRYKGDKLAMILAVTTSFNTLG